MRLFVVGELKSPCRGNSRHGTGSRTLTWIGGLIEVDQAFNFLAPGPAHVGCPGHFLAARHIIVTSKFLGRTELFNLSGKPTVQIGIFQALIPSNSIPVRSQIVANSHKEAGTSWNKETFRSKSRNLQYSLPLWHPLPILQSSKIRQF